MSGYYPSHVFDQTRVHDLSPHHAHGIYTVQHEDTAPQHLRECSNKRCTNTVSDALKMCEDCRAKYRGYATRSKKAKESETNNAALNSGGFVRRSTPNQPEATSPAFQHWDQTHIDTNTPFCTVVSQTDCWPLNETSSSLRLASDFGGQPRHNEDFATAQTDSRSTPTCTETQPTAMQATSTTLRKCSAGNCKTIIPENYELKTCEKCRVQGRSYGKRKREKWKKERAKALETLEEMKQDEDDRRMAAGLLPLAEASDNERHEFDDSIFSRLPPPGPPTWPPTSISTVVVRMCSVPNCGALLPHDYDYKKCERHRKRIQTSGASITKVVAQNMQGQWKKITTPIGKKSGQPESSTTTLGNNNTVEAPVGVPPERSDESNATSQSSPLSSRPEIIRTYHTCSVKSCRNLLNPEIIWKMCELHRSRDKHYRRRKAERAKMKNLSDKEIRRDGRAQGVDGMAATAAFSTAVFTSDCLARGTPEVPDPANDDGNAVEVLKTLLLSALQNAQNAESSIASSSDSVIIVDGTSVPQDYQAELVFVDPLVPPASHRTTPYDSAISTTVEQNASADLRPAPSIVLDPRQAPFATIAPSVITRASVLPNTNERVLVDLSRNGPVQSDEAAFRASTEAREADAVQRATAAFAPYLSRLRVESNHTILPMTALVSAAKRNTSAMLGISASSAALPSAPPVIASHSVSQSSTRQVDTSARNLASVAAGGVTQADNRKQRQHVLNIQQTGQPAATHNLNRALLPTPPPTSFFNLQALIPQHPPMYMAPYPPLVYAFQSYYVMPPFGMYAAHVRVLYPYQPAISEAFVLPPYPYHGVVVPSPGYFTSLQSGVSPGISMSDARQPYDPASPKTRYTILEPSEARISVPRVERTREDGDSGERSSKRRRVDRQVIHADLPSGSTSNPLSKLCAMKGCVDRPTKVYTGALCLKCKARAQKRRELLKRRLRLEPRRSRLAKK